eukprot:scaffold113_cov339-Pavlova_lutheri.AAC.34
MTVWGRGARRNVRRRGTSDGPKGVRVRVRTGLGFGFEPVGVPLGIPVSIGIHEPSERKGSVQGWTRGDSWEPWTRPNPNRRDPPPPHEPSPDHRSRGVWGGERGAAGRTGDGGRWYKVGGTPRGSHVADPGRGKVQHVGRTRVDSRVEERYGISRDRSPPARK